MANEVKALNDDALREIEARRAAVKSKWTAAQTPNDGRWAILGPRFESPFMTGVPVTTKEVAEFISKAPDDIDALCATVRALRQQVAEEEQYSNKLALKVTICEGDLLADDPTKWGHESTITALREQLAAAQLLSESTLDHNRALMAELAQVTQERDDYKRRLRPLDNYNDGTI